MQIPTWFLIVLVTVLVLALVLRGSLRRLVDAWVVSVTAAAEVKRQSATATAALRSAKLRRAALRIEAASGQLEADRQVTAGLVKPRVAAESAVIAAAGVTRAKAAAAQSPGKVKVRRERTGPPFRTRLGHALIWLVHQLDWLLVLAAVVGAIAAAIWGAVRLNVANNRDHYVTVVVCRAQLNDYDQPVLATSTGDFRLDPGFYGTTYYAKPEGAQGFFRASQAYRLRYHGGWVMDRFVDRAEVSAELPGRTCVS